VYPLTYDDIKTSGIPHPLGEIWAVTLWEIHWAFIDQYGLDTSWEDEESGGYLADDGVGSNDRTDGTESFEPLPTAIQSLKVQEEVTGKVLPGDEVIVTVTAQNHIPETQTGVVIKSIIRRNRRWIAMGSIGTRQFWRECLVCDSIRGGCGSRLLDEYTITRSLW